VHNALCITIVLFLQGNIMKKIALAAAITAALASSFSAQAATETGNFNVSVTLTSVCKLKTTTAPTLSFGTYVAFQTTALPNSTGVDIEFECTRGYTAAPTVSLDTGTDKAAGATGPTTSGEGVVAGLNYTLAVAAGAKAAGLAATVGAPGSIGTADVYKYTITGNIPANQAGDSSKATTQARVLTITY
jgi:spore coat protein U-like protein